MYAFFLLLYVTPRQALNTIIDIWVGNNIIGGKSYGARGTKEEKKKMGMRIKTSPPRCRRSWLQTATALTAAVHFTAVR